jgi:hypothetical protein
MHSQCHGKPLKFAGPFCLMQTRQQQRSRDGCDCVCVCERAVPNKASHLPLARFISVNATRATLLSVSTQRSVEFSHRARRRPRSWTRIRLASACWPFERPKTQPAPVDNPIARTLDVWHPACRGKRLTPAVTPRLEK